MFDIIIQVALMLACCFAGAVWHRWYQEDAEANRVIDAVLTKILTLVVWVHGLATARPTPGGPTADQPPHLAGAHGAPAAAMPSGPTSASVGVVEPPPF